MAEKALADGTLIYQRSHRYFELKTGHLLMDYSKNNNGEPFTGTFMCELDDEHPDGKLSTFFMSPAIVGTKQFYNDLTEIGIDNIEVHPALIRDEVNNRNIEDYLLLNILGRISCAVL